MFENFRKNWRTILKRTVFELAVPIAAGVITVVWVWWKKSSFGEGIAAFGLGYLFFMSVQALLLRNEKYVREENDAKDTRASFTSLRQAIEALNAQGLVRQSTATPPIAERPISAGARSVDDSVRERAVAEARTAEERYKRKRGLELDEAIFFGQAEEAFRHGLYYSAALTAAIGFEQALRQTAMLLQLDVRWPLGATVNELRKRTDDPTVNEKLGTLLKTRNSLVHPPEFTFTGDIDERQARELIDAFHNGVQYLNSLGNHWHPRSTGSGLLNRKWG